MHLGVPPTAVQAEADAQATAFRNVNCAPLGVGVDWISQLLPFHRSARAWNAPEELM